MFDHLDDPEPFEPGAPLRRSVSRRARSLRRRRRLVAGGLATVAAVVVSAIGAAALVDRRLEQVEHLDVAGLREAEAPGEPQVVLFVGVDSDRGLPRDQRDPQRPDDPTGGRTDTMVLVRVDPRRETVAFLPLARDLLVDIPGHGRDRLNQAYDLGGAGLLVDTIRRNLGIEVDHYLQTDFAGTVAMGDSMGGVALWVDAPIRDRHVGLDLSSGCTTFDGRGLLALGRSRHLEVLRGGRWQLDRTSDIGRMERAQVIGEALLRSLTHISATDPLALRRLVDAFVEHATVDSRTSSADLLELFRGISGGRPVPLRLPMTEAVDAGRAVLVPDGPVAPTVDAFSGTAAPPAVSALGWADPISASAPSGVACG